MVSALMCGGWGTAAFALAVASATRRRHLDLVEALAAVSHEIRGPLAAARLGLHESHPERALSPQRRRAVELELQRAGLALDDLARLQSRALRPALLADPQEPLPAPLQLSRFDLQELVAESVEACQGFAAARGASLEFEAATAPLVVRADRLRVSQATGNLLTNAVEHGGGRVQVRCRADGQRVRVDVQDHGPGLPAPVDVLRLQRRRGTRGRGLAIAAAVAEAHGGRVAAAPAQIGARVLLELPAAELSEREGRPRA